MAAMTAMTQQQQNEINVASLSIEQLYQFRQQVLSNYTGALACRVLI